MKQTISIVARKPLSQLDCGDEVKIRLKKYQARYKIVGTTGNDKKISSLYLEKISSKESKYA